MVKREKSPVIRDDAKYLVVHQPYPLNADFELPGDYIAFAFWIALILGDYKHVWGIHHKPTARSTVIVEVDRKLNLSNLLGEHRWKDILKRPKKEERPRVSQVFYSIYKTTREAGKDGWKRIQVDHDWFTERGWNLTDAPFKYPYPASLWCPPLAEDPTGKPIARPLPVSAKPPPPKTPSLVPGSVQWIQANSGSGSASSSAPSVASTSSIASGSTSQRGRDTAKGGRRGRPAHIQDPSAGFVQTLAAGNSNPWARIAAAPPSTSSGASSPRPMSTRSPTVLSYSSSVTASRTPTPSAFPPLPGSKRVNTAPFASPLTNTTRASSPFSSVYASPTPSPEPPTPTSPRSPGSVTSPSWADQVDLDVPLDPPGLGLPPSLTSSRVTEEEERAALSLAGLSLKTSDDEDEDGDEMYVPFDGDDDDDDHGDVGYAGQAESSWWAASSEGTAKLWSSAETSSQKAHSESASASASASGDVVDLWAGDKVKKEETEPLCSIHGLKCTKGICSEYRKGLREKKKAAEAEERAKKMKEKQAAKNAKRKEKRNGRGIRSIRDRRRGAEEPEEEEEEEEEKEEEKEEEEEEEEKEEKEERRKERRNGRGIRSIRSRRAAKEPEEEKEEKEEEEKEEEEKEEEEKEEKEDEEKEDEKEDEDEGKEQAEEKKQEPAPNTFEARRAAKRATKAWKQTTAAQT